METGKNGAGDVPAIAPGKCRVNVIQSLGWVECLERDADKCTHALFFGSGFLCRHPDHKPRGSAATSGRPPPPEQPPA
jgi:hypothetical protein